MGEIYNILFYYIILHKSGLLQLCFKTKVTVAAVLCAELSIISALMYLLDQVPQGVSCGIKYFMNPKRPSAVKRSGPLTW